MPGEELRELHLGRLLSGTRPGERGAVPEILQPRPRPLPEVEELRDPFQLAAKVAVVGGGERDLLRESGTAI